MISWKQMGFASLSLKMMAIINPNTITGVLKDSFKHTGLPMRIVCFLVWPKAVNLRSWRIWSIVVDKELRSLGIEGLKAAAYVPIIAKEGEIFGIIMVGSKKPGHFSLEEKHILELLANRIGVAMENSMLQEEFAEGRRNSRPGLSKILPMVL